MSTFPPQLLDFVKLHEQKHFRYPFLPDANPFGWILDHSGAPWLRLEIDAPFAAMLDEAKSLRHRFVPHRSNDGQGWHSLCIHGIAADMTENHSHYGIAMADANYHWTEIAALSPVTTDFFKNLFPYTSYLRLRYMLIEPGGYILPHSDSARNFLGLAVNLSLNNPAGCQLVTELGTVPFADAGSVMMFNNHYQHCVINRSAVSRYHIIVHGTWDSTKFPEVVVKSYRSMFA